MKKVDFYNLFGAYDHLGFHIFDYWYDWREKQGLPVDVDDLDFRFDIRYKDNEQTVVIRTSYGEDEFPVDFFFEKVSREDEPQMLWHCNYWDGPLSGIARYQGQIVWFECVEWEHDNLFRARWYEIYEMSQEEIDHEIFVHNRWRKQGGRHCDYCDDFWDPNDPKLSGVSAVLQDFYDWYKGLKKRDYTKNKVLGKFEYCQFWRERSRRFRHEEVDQND